MISMASRNRRRATSARRPALCQVAAAVLLCACGAGEIESRKRAGVIDVLEDLYAVSVVDASHAVAVGYRGAVYRTEDGGDSWRSADSPAREPLYGVSMANSRVGWAVGRTGTILRTEDGGRSWIEQANPKRAEATHLFSVHAFDRNRALAVGALGARIATSDAGRTWRDNSLRVRVDDPQFVWLEPDEQAAVLRGGRVYADVTLQDVYCLASGSHCWIVGEFGTIFRSQDGGLSFARSEIASNLPEVMLSFEFDARELSPSALSGVAAFVAKLEPRSDVGVEIDPTVSDAELSIHRPEELFDLIASRLDGVRSALEQAGVRADRLRRLHLPPWEYADWIEYDPRYLERYFAQIRGPVAGVALREVREAFLFDVHFSDSEKGWIAGLGGVTLHSDDGGRRWTRVGGGARDRLDAAAASPFQTAWVRGKGTGCVACADGIADADEAAPIPGGAGFVRDVGFAPDGSGLGFMVGGHGAIWRSRDGGGHWEQVLGP